MVRALSMVTVALLGGIATGAEPAPGAEVARVRELIAAVRYVEAGALIRQTLAQGRLPRHAALELRLLEGIVHASRGARDEARAAFQRVLSLDPARALPEGLAPKVRTPFAEAQAWLATAGPLSFEVGALEAEGGGLSLRTEVRGDGLRQLERVRISTREPGGDWEAREIAPGAAVRVTGPRVEWYVEALDGAQNVLLERGSARAPLIAERRRGPACKDGSLSDAQGGCVDGVEQAGPATRRLRPLAIALSAAAIGCAGAGLAFGIQSSVARSAFENAPVREDGVTEALTRRQALELESRSAAFATTANTLYAVAGAAAVAAVVVWIVDGARAPVAPSAGSGGSAAWTF